ncbi:hypothetical protein N657DRAFT_600495 [Parathielavia appendiculata]|uniref:Rhodopsin domain-containing protein n=1 Tax=Parathielavia appendiculata TaxID=2587402 RepID=A0AAN6Z1K1_9PEZI|nr:hypothetical protein N657DRAFT_600495 [Parathielavia appendiculata]
MVILPRRPEHGNVLDIPTPPLQAAGLFVIIFFTALAFVTYCLRAYTRIRTRTWGLDDYLVTFAMIFSLMMVGPFYMYIKLNYFGWRQQDVPPFDPSPGMFWFYLAQLFYNPILALVKASVLCFLYRLGGQKPGVKYAIHFLNAFNGLQAVAVFLVAALQCLPVAANWDFALKADPNTKCIDNAFHVIISCITILTDFAVVLLPFWIFLGLKMPRGAKIAVLGIFMLGLAVTIIGIVRLHGVIKLFYLPKAPDADPYHDITVTLSVVEANIAIVSASAPALRPLFRSLMPSWFAGSSGRYGVNKYNNAYPNSNTPYYSGAAGSVLGGHGQGTHTGSAVRGGGPGSKAGGNGVSRHSSIQLKNLTRSGKNGQHTECRSISPSGSEEEIMTYNGIMRTTDVRVHFDGGRDSTLPAGGADLEESSRASSELKKEQVEKRTL